jgi:hypothetical protein
MKQVREKITDLQQDYNTRQVEFWGGLLKEELPDVRKALRPCIAYCETNLRSPLFDLDHNARYGNERIDSICINLTSYLTRCESTEVRDLHDRHHLLEMLREFDLHMSERVLKVLQIPGVSKHLTRQAYERSY